MSCFDSIVFNFKLLHLVKLNSLNSNFGIIAYLIERIIIEILIAQKFTTLFSLENNL